MEFTVEQISKKLQIYDGILIRVSAYLGVQVYDQTVDSNIGSKAVLKDSFVRFLVENASFFKRYHDDYYSVKSPETIASTIHRKESVVKKHLLQLYPNYFINEEFIPECGKKLKYISSFEIDFAIGNSSTLNMNSLGQSVWHLGMKQQLVIDRLNSQVPSNPWVKK
jgi:hypothetical protein